MKTVYLESFKKDIRKIKDKQVKNGLLNLIEKIKASGNITEIINLKKIKGSKGFYRVKLGNYRVGVKLEGDTLTFIRFLHRKDIYRYFP